MEEDIERIKKEVLKLISNSIDIEKLLKTRNLYKTTLVKDPDTKFTKEDIDLIFPHVNLNSRKAYFNILQNFTENNLLDYKNTIELIENKKNKMGKIISISTKKNYFSTIISYFTLILNEDTIKKKYGKKYDEYSKKIEETPNKKLYISYDKLMEKIMSIKDNDYNTFVPLFLQCKFALRSDFRTVKVRNFNRSIDNFIDLNTHSLIFNKRTKKHDYIRFDLKKELKEKYEYIIPYINEVIKSRDYLFVNTQGKNMSTTNYTDFMKRCGSKIELPYLTANDIRHAFVTKYIGNEEFANQVEKNNNQLGHTINTALKYYSGK